MPPDPPENDVEFDYFRRLVSNACNDYPGVSQFISQGQAIPEIQFLEYNPYPYKINNPDEIALEVAFEEATAVYTKEIKQLNKAVENLATQVNQLEREKKLLLGAVKQNIGNVKKVANIELAKVTNVRPIGDYTIEYTITAYGDKHNSPHIFEQGEELKFELAPATVQLRNRKIYNE